MKKVLFFLFMAIMVTSCQTSEPNVNSAADLSIESAKDNQCIQCTQRIQASLAICLQQAGNDQNKIRACNAKAASDWTTQCSAICKPALPTNEKAMNIEIGETTQATKTDKPADKSIHLVSALDDGTVIKERCSGSGHLRKITVNGVCYSQMCCGGEWKFFYWDRNGRRDWCTCNLGESWTVNCDGNNWIVGCR